MHSVQRQDKGPYRNRNHDNEHRRRDPAAERQIRSNGDDIVHQQQKAQARARRQPRKGIQRCGLEEVDLLGQAVDVPHHLQLVDRVIAGDTGDHKGEKQERPELNEQRCARSRGLFENSAWNEP